METDLQNLSIEDELNARHKKERKELLSKIQALKKSAGKGDKKRKKEIQEEIVQLEIDLDRRHAEELAEAAASVAPKTTQSTVNEGVKSDEESKPSESTTRVSKAQKRREKKAAEEKIRQAEILAQEKLNKNGPRVVEMETIKKLLTKRQLVMHSVASDGDCLYNAIRNQLSVTGRKVPDVSWLRQQTANYIQQNKDSLIFYMTNPDTGDCLNDEEFKNYCESVRDTPAWGGQIEITALSKILEAPIEVIQANGPPTIQGSEQYDGPNLVITYHRHMYSLGEHYNGSKPSAIDNEANAVD